MNDDNSSSQRPRRLEVDLLFLERTFRSRAKAEELLNPEREAVTINPSDYEATVSYFPNKLRRNYNTIGTIAGAGLGYTLRQPKWTPGRLGTVVFMSALTGRAVGSAYSVFSAYNFFRTLQDPAGFGKAIDNVKQRIEHPGSVPSATSDLPPAEDAPAPIPPVLTSSNDSPDAPAPTSGAPAGAWDRIRAANTKQARQSSWDSLRQTHERTNIPTAQKQASSAEQGNRFYDDTDRAAEQAKFDELLEKERNFK
ncbi:hypothetical protein BKA70DRAFT_1555834 [Coprinopsis sp. MPI-PUGE-AT-0042]|nr:hypothetical protein BKA70DRAFT_1555834 [Coprinopsis sp. MPI-PUGE-AT-0042]